MFNEEMEKQKELFEQFQKPDKKLKFLSSNNRFFQNRLYVLQFSIEKLIFLAIGIIVLIIFTFCFGVERGKRLAKASIQTPKASILVPKAANLQKPKDFSTYSVVTASYVNKKSAQEFVDKMRKAGFPAYLVSSGKYFVIKVGDYKDKRQAEAVLLQIKKLSGSSGGYVKASR